MLPAAPKQPEQQQDEQNRRPEAEQERLPQWRAVEPATLATAAIDKAVRSRQPAAIEPGKYTVVLEPAALADLLGILVFSADARQADEGRSFFSRKGGGNRIGEQVLGEKVTIYSDPADPLAPTLMFDAERPADQAHHLGREGRLEGPDLLALLGAEAETGTDRGPGQRDYGRRCGDHGRPDRRDRAWRVGHAVLVHP